MVIKESPRNQVSNDKNEFLVMKGSKCRNEWDDKNPIKLLNKFTPLDNDKPDDVSKHSRDTREVEDFDNFRLSSRKTKANVKKKKSINFVGDSLNPYHLKQKLKRNDKLYIQSYHSAKTSTMRHHINASKEYDPSVYLVHIGTNDLKYEKEPKEIAQDIINIGTQVKNESDNVFISGIVFRRDELNAKALKVNEHLKLRCPDYTMIFIDNSKVVTNSHLNKSGLHLNKEGSKILSEHFLCVINT